jgi:hypothetical protein
MAVSTCISCASTQFEANTTTVHGTKSQVIFIQCAQCGGVVGVMDYSKIGAALSRIATVFRQKPPNAVAPTKS